MKYLAIIVFDGEVNWLGSYNEKDDAIAALDDWQQNNPDAEEVVMWVQKGWSVRHQGF